MSKSAKKSTGSGNEKKNVDKIPQKPRNNGNTARQLMTRHLKNEKDVITDEEFKNLSIQTDVNAETSHEPLELENDHERPHDEEKDHNIKTPWDVIS